MLDVRDLRRFDPTISMADAIETVGSDAATAPHRVDRAAYLAAALSAAAVGAATARCSGREQRRKREIDRCATEAAEAVFNRVDERLTVASGEGRGDRSPGADAGQTLAGAGNGDDGARALLDYVDGTTLVARGLPGAIAMGAVGSGFAMVPDLEGFAVMVDRHGVELPLLSEAPVDILQSILATRGTGAAPFRGLTHTSGSAAFHRSLRSLLDRSPLATAVDPGPVPIEAPHVLARAGLARDGGIDGLIGVLGLPEMAFVAALLELLPLPHSFAVVPCGVAAARGASVAEPFSRTTPPTSSELQELRRCGLTWPQMLPRRSLVPDGSVDVAAVFAITPNTVLQLPGVEFGPTSTVVTGWLIVRGSASRVRIERQRI